MYRRFFSNELRELYEEGQLPQVVTRCQAMIRDLRALYGDQHPDVVILLDNMVQALFEMREYPAAIETKKELLRIDLALFGEWSMQYVMDISTLGLLYLYSGQLDDSKTALDRALQLVQMLPPDQQWEQATILIHLAYLDTERRTFRSAERLLLAATKRRLNDYNWVHPQFGAMFYHLSRLYRKMGKRFAAERAIWKAIRIYRDVSYTENAEYARIVAFLGNLQADEGKFPEATESYSTAIEILRRTRPPGQFWISDIERRLSQLPPPGTENGGRKTGHYLSIRAAAHAHRRREDQEIADFTEAIRLKRDDAPAYANRGLAYARKSNFDQAIDDYTEAIRLSPNWAQAFEYRGLAHYRIGDWSSAISDFTRALELKPDLKRALEFRALVHESLGDHASATDDRLMADELGRKGELEDGDPY